MSTKKSLFQKYWQVKNKWATPKQPKKNQIFLIHSSIVKSHKKSKLSHTCSQLQFKNSLRLSPTDDRQEKKRILCKVHKLQKRKNLQLKNQTT